jgi:hypothetical protein
MTDIVQKTVGANALYVIDESNNTLVVDQTNGRVGINNTNPGYNLTITGATHTTANLSAGTDLFLVDEGNSRVSVGTTTGVAGFAFNVAGNTTLVGDVLTGTAMKWDNSTGRLGIGTISPTATLHASTADDIVAKFVSTDATASIELADNSTTNNAVLTRVGQTLTLCANGGNVAIGNSISSYNGSAPTDGQLLIGDTASGLFDAATLTAGSNITITNAAGAITIAASGGGGGVSIGDAVGSGTSGSILFVDASTNLAQDNGELYWDNTNNRLGIGTNSPSAAIEVDAGASTEYAILSTGANGRVGLTTQYGGIHFNNVEATADLWQLSERDTANFDIAFGTPDAGNNVSATNTKLRITSGGNVGIGLGNTDPSQELHVVGTIRQTNVTDAIVYADANGDLGALTVGSGLSLVGSTLTATGGGGGGSPGGANTQVQYNNGGAFGADGNFIYDSTAPALAVGFTAAGQSSGSISSDVMTAGNNIAVRYNQSGATAGTYGLTLSDANMSWPGAPVGSSTTIMPAIDLSAGNYDFATLNGAGNCSQTHYLMITVGSQGADAILMPDPGAVGIPPGSRWTICCLDNVGGMGNIEFGGQVVPACPPLAGVFTNVIISGIGSITLFTDGASWFVESDTVVQNRGRITIEYL